jgi:outer membrane lipoprotein SlyB
LAAFDEDLGVVAVLGEAVEAVLGEAVEAVLGEVVEAVLGEAVEAVLGEVVEAVLGEVVEAELVAKELSMALKHKSISLAAIQFQYFLKHIRTKIVL